MKTPLIDRLNPLLVTIFSVFWVAVLLVSYLGFHPYYFTGLFELPNAGLLGWNLLFAFAGWGWWVFSGKAGRSRKINGLLIYGLFLIMQAVTLVGFSNSYDIFQNPLPAFSFLGMNILVHASLFLLYTLSYAVGQPVIERFAEVYSKGTSHILSVATGIVFIGLVLFFLGLFHIHTTVVTGLLAIGVLGIRYKQVLQFWQNTLVKRKAFKFEQKWLQLPVFLLISTLAVNGLGAIKPFPTGFDGAALYMNTTQLIADYKGLIEGGQAYNWQLILSLGEVLFGKAVFSIGIAHFSFLLVLFVAFRLSRLMLNRSWSWITVWLLALNPSISFHYLYDEKVDLGFTFMTLATVLLIIEFWTGKKKTNQGAENRQFLFGLSLEQGMLMLTGLMLGFTFGVKYTGLISIASVLAILGYRYGSFWLSAAVTVFFTGIVFLFGSDSFGYLPLGETPPWIPGAIGLAISAVLLGFAVKNKIQFRPLVQSMLMVGGMALLCFSPWMVRNLVANGQLGIGQLLESPFPTPEIIIEDKAVDFSELLTNLIAEKAQERGVGLTSNQKIKISNWLDEKKITAYESLDRPALLKFLRDEIATDEQVLKLKKIQLDKASLTPDIGRADEEVGEDSNGVISASELAKREEIQRYLGYESGLPLYATLPYDLTMNTNILKSQYVDLSFLFLVLFPIFLLRKKENKYIVQNLVVIGISLFLLLVGVWTVEQQESFAALKEQLLLNSVPAYEGYANGLWTAVNNSILTLANPFSPLFQLLSGIGFAGVFVSLLVLGGAMVWIVRGHWPLENDRLKYAFLFVLSFGGLWLLLGSGIPWYGFPMFVGLMIYLVFAAVKSGFDLKSAQSWAIGVSFLGYSLLGFSLVFISSLQAPRNAGLIYQEPVLRSFGEGLNQTETLSSFKPYLGEAINYINQNPADKIYRVGTFFNYHIAFNDRRVLEDNQLGKYDEFMRSLDGDEDAFMDLLKANGFRYILFDMNTASLDRTPEKTLTDKTRRFSQMLFTSPKVRLIFTDNVVQGAEGETVPFGKHRIAGRAGIRGETVYRGSYLLFEL